MSHHILDELTAFQHNARKIVPMKPGEQQSLADQLEGIPDGFRSERSLPTLPQLLLERNNEWAVQRGRYMSLETIAPLVSYARSR